MHMSGILSGFTSQLSNGRVEGINSPIQPAKARAREYRTTRSLIAGKLTQLPASPYARLGAGVREPIQSEKEPRKVEDQVSTFQHKTFHADLPRIRQVTPQRQPTGRGP